MKSKIVHITLGFVLSLSIISYSYAASNKPVELAADTIEYDSVKGVMTAQGNVRMVQENAVMTGTNAEYNSKTKEAHVYGGVQVVQEDATLLAEEVRSYDNNHIIASGSPILTKGSSQLEGPQIDYYSDKQYAIVNGWARLQTEDSILTANQIESFFSEDRAVAQGNVHIVSDVRKLDAVSDHAVYYGSKEQQGKTVLTGNARAVQEGNVLTGNTLTLYMDNKVIDVQGRSKLVITPQ
ncbi:lipopolysaccharide export system protein LptA [Pelosinus fermentans]|uniref:LptA/OstA family protein n=1 Tax=Pelosinus fermentans TaxID=365349 RepID=UPI0002685A67|nr:LptA/OstA family protein [Pelosinus fermentans]OAM92746.1 OstA family protein [Pelosinus fermentans DSM 17108]SDQ55618.1 lipopolysaccharide export system protein LptA [Pelosinus fermentans]